MIRDIAGRQNHSIKLAHKLQKKKHRRERGLFVAEGLDLLLIAVERGADIREVLIRDDLVDRLPEVLLRAAQGDRVDIGACSEEVLAAASSLGGAADVVFMCGARKAGLGDLDLAGGVVVFLQEVGDPGNVGTVVRSAVAFGADGLVCSPGTADPFGPKAVRAGMGAQFLLPIVVEVTPADLAASLEKLERRGLKRPVILVADAHEGDDVREVTRSEGAVLVLGAERTGPGEGWSGHSRVHVRQARFESLNVAMAGTVLLYEVCRGRGERHG